jgi:hypothetical protein
MTGGVCEEASRWASIALPLRASLALSPCLTVSWDGIIIPGIALHEFLLTGFCYSESNVGKGMKMARSVDITTPIPTLDEIGDRLGMSQARRTRVLKIVRNSSSGKFTSRTGAQPVRAGKKAAARKKS